MARGKAAGGFSIILVTALLAGSLYWWGGGPLASPAAGAGAFKAFAPRIAADSAGAAGGSPGTNPYGVRYCEWIPGVSQPAQMPPEVLDLPPAGPPAAPAPPPQTTVPASTTQAQLDVFEELWAAVEQNYVDPAFNGAAWDTVYDTYRAYIEAGLAEPDFDRLMDAMLGELADGHSDYQSPAEVAEEDALLQQGANYVGIGVYGQQADEAGAAVVVAVFPGSPAASAGLRPHDLILEVDGKPPIDPESGVVNLRGPTGTVASLVVRRPGGATFPVQITRATVTGNVPVDFCIVMGTSVGYIMVPTLLDSSVTAQLRDALEALSRGGPLSGLLLDNRMNSGGLQAQAAGLLGFFTGGLQGYSVSRDASEPFIVQPEDVAGSQSVPLVVLVDMETASFGEVTSGILRQEGRATTVGRTSAGNVELLTGFNLPNGGRAWIATYTFQPLGLAPGAWEDTGIVADIAAPSRWDLFTGANDPAMDRALDLLGVE